MSNFKQDIQINNLYNRVGGEDFFINLVNKFYEYIESDKVLRPMYPEDLNPGKVHLSSFLAQYWGGPNNYSLQRGHPRLKMRHSNFKIGKKERDIWIKHMCAALKSMNISEDDSTEMLSYFEKTATNMVNFND